MSVIRNDEGKSLYPSPATNYVSEAALTGGGAASTLTVRTTLVNRNGNRGYIKNDGTGDFTFQISTDGTNYNTAVTLKNGETFDLTGMSVNKIKITPSASASNYRVVVW